MNARRGFDRGVMRLTLLVAGIFVAGAVSVRGQEQKPMGESPRPKPAATSPKSEPAQKSPEPKQTAKEPKPEPAAKERKREPALRGYCPAAYLLLGSAVKGNPAYESTYGGETYYLSSTEAREKFDADPEKFLPRFGAVCTTALGGPYGNWLPSDPEVFDIRDGKVYLFSSERAKRAYNTKPQWVIDRAERLFAEPLFEGYCLVSLQQRNKALKGHQSAAYLFRGRYYWFLNSAAKMAFKANPEKYVPKYDGYCAEGVSRNKRYPADPAQFVVFNNRTYLFYDAKTRMAFLTNPAPMIEKADANWATLKDDK